MPGDGVGDLAESGLVFDGTITIDYGQFYLQSADYKSEFVFEDAFTGQSNGLCGAVTAGRLVFITGPNVGDPPLRVEEHICEPTAGRQVGGRRGSIADTL